MKQTEKIQIKGVNNTKYVFLNGVKVGELRKFCCGIDFRIDGKNVLFSILSVKFGSHELRYCIKKLLSIKIENKKFKHFNFNYKTASDPELLANYENKLNAS